jgi:carboxyl-terminal processing protease
LVQRPFHLMDGSLIRLTIARYYTPTGRLIQKPYSEGYENYSTDIYKRMKHGELYTSDSIHFTDSLKYYTLSSKRLVYGGGGIMPDVFIPYDTTSFPGFYQKIMKDGKLYEYILSYVDQNRSKLNALYHDFDFFKNNFQITDEFLQSLVKFAILENIQDKLSNEELLAVEINKSFEIPNSIKVFNLDNPRLRNNLKALIARDLYGNEEYIEILNNTDDAFQKAVEVINNEQQYYSLLGLN